MSPHTAPDTTLALVGVLAAEQAIVDRLKAKIDVIPTEPLPIDIKQSPLRHQLGRYLVSYVGGNAGDVLDTFGDEIAQDRQMRFAVTVQARSLKGHEGAYTYIEAAIAALVGLKIRGFPAPLRLVSERWIDLEAGVWSYVLQFATRTVLVQLPDDVVDTLLQRITLEAGTYFTAEIT